MFDQEATQVLADSALDGIAGIGQSLIDTAESLSLIASRLHSPNVADANGEAANLVDVGSDIARGLFAIAKAINRVADANAQLPTVA